MKKSIAAKLFALTLTAATILTLAVPTFAAEDTSAETSVSTEDKLAELEERYDELIYKQAVLTSEWCGAHNKLMDLYKRCNDLSEELSKADEKSDKETYQKLHDEYVEVSSDYDEAKKIEEDLSEKIEVIQEKLRETSNARLNEELSIRASCENTMNNIRKEMNTAFENGDYELYDQLNIQYSEISARWIAADNIIKELS